MSYLFLVNSIFLLNPTLRKNPKKNIYIIHNKENIVRNISRTSLFQQLLANKQPRLRDSVPIVIWLRGGLGLVTDKKTKKKNPVQSKNRARPRAARLINKNCIHVKSHSCKIILSSWPVRLKSIHPKKKNRKIRGPNIIFLEEKEREGWGKGQVGWWLRMKNACKQFSEKI